MDEGLDVQLQENYLQQHNVWSNISESEGVNAQDLMQKSYITCFHVNLHVTYLFILYYNHLNNGERKQS
jgi:hypothetical protein